MPSSNLGEILRSGNAKASSTDQIKQLIEEARKQDIKVIRVQVTEEILSENKEWLRIVKYEKTTNNKNLSFEIHLE